MREILFRGKRIDNGEWVYGIPVECVTNCYEKSTRIIKEYTEDELDNFYPSLTDEIVKPETVGQYTGQKDKTGEKIFEGDIVYCDCENNIAIIDYSEKSARFVILLKGENYYTDFDSYSGNYLVIIGNIYDNHKRWEAEE